MKKILFYFPILLLLNSCATKTTNGVKKAFANTGKQQVVKETIAFEVIDNRLFVPIEINNEKLNFLLHPYYPTTITPEFYSTSNSPFLYSETIKSRNKVGPLVQGAMMPVFKLGKNEFKNQPAEIRSQMGLSKFLEKDIYGSIGFSTMKNARWLFDLKQNTVTINAEKKTPVHTWEVVERGVYKTPAIKVMLSDVLWAYGQIDLNTYKGLVLPNRLKSPLNKVISSHKRYFIPDANNMEKRDTITVATIPFLRIGNNTILKNVDVTFENTHFVKIGKNFVQEFLIDFDLDKNKIVLYPNLSKEEKAKEDYKNMQKAFGIHCYTVNQHLILTSIDEGSPAMEAGLQLLDEITAINDISFENVAADKHFKVNSSYFDCNEEELKLMVKRDGLVKTYFLQRKK